MKGKKTKTIRISEEVYRQVKVYVASTDDKITDFADKALLAKLPKKAIKPVL